jgi:hypothetical protein
VHRKREARRDRPIKAELKTNKKDQEDDGKEDGPGEEHKENKSAEFGVKGVVDRDRHVGREEGQRRRGGGRDGGEGEVVENGSCERRIGEEQDGENGLEGLAPGKERRVVCTHKKRY